MFFSSSTTRTVAMAVPDSLSPRQLEGEAAPLAYLAVDEDAAAVRLDDVADDGQPQPGGAGLAVVLPLDESLEDALAPLGRDAGARVAHAHLHGAVLGTRGQRDAAAARRVAQ